MLWRRDLESLSMSEEKLGQQYLAATRAFPGVVLVGFGRPDQLTITR